jgi:hypothetical protein
MHKINKKSFILALIISVTGFINLNSNAYAQEQKIIELKAINCREVLKMEGKERELTLVFFHGFFTGKNNEMTINIDSLKNKTDKILDYCINNPNDSLIRAFELE